MMNFRDHVLAKKQVIGCWLFSPNAMFMEIASRAGIDLILIDMEHGEVLLSDILALLRAGQGRGMAVLVRPPSHDAAILSKLADFGVDGVVVPKVNSGEEARAVALACRYPPKGSRGLATGSVRASGYGLNGNYRSHADASILVAVQIETTTAVENLAEIAGEEEVDMLFVGPNDLSGSMGYPGVTDEASERISQVIAEAASFGKPIGTIPYSGRSAQDLRADEVTLVVAGSDVAALRGYLSDFKQRYT